MREQKKEKKRSISRVVCSVVILLAGLAWTALSGWMLQTEFSVICRNLLISVLVSFIIVFSYVGQKEERQLFSWNIGHMGRYTAVVCLTVLFFAAMGQVPFLAAPISAAAVVLTVFSGGVSGVFGYLALVVQYSVLYGIDTEQIVALMLTGMVGAVLFSGLDRDFRYGGCLFAYLAADLVVFALFFMATQTETALGDAALYLGIQLFAALVGLLLVLKVFGSLCIYRDDGAFLRINDPEYGLLVRLKEADREAYFHAIHTAYLSEKVARKIGIDPVLTKAGGYYHKIGLVQGKDTIQNTLLVAAADKFPKSLIRLLKEYGIKNTKRLSKEAAVVQIADVVVSSISYMFRKDHSAVLDYDKIIDVIIKKKIESGDFDYCLLTMEELSKIKKCFAEEKLYYDFLR